MDGELTAQLRKLMEAKGDVYKRQRFVQTLKSVMPMLLIGIVVLMLVTYIPQVTTFLPGLIK